MKRERAFSIPRFIFELFIVFIGVYGAFELNRFQQNKRENTIKQNYFITFNSELRKLIADIRNAEKSVVTEMQELGSYHDSIAERPFIPAFVSFRQSLLITQAGFNDDVFVQLDPSLASSLTGGYDYVKSLENMVDVFNQTSASKLSGLLWKDLFDRNNNLKDEFFWYQSRLKLLQSNFRFIGDMMENQAVPAVEVIIREFDN